MTISDDGYDELTCSLKNLERSIKSKSKKHAKDQEDSNEKGELTSSSEEYIDNNDAEKLPSIPSDERFFQDRSLTDLDWKNLDKQELTFKNCVISNSSFVNANLNGLHLESCKVFNCNFENASIEDAVFRECIFYEKTHGNGCNFRLTNLRRSKFVRCDISMSKFSRADLFQITLDECQA
ncbi:pentapeptide repeat-containing protein [Microbulbifer sp. ZKSA006]|uniref:pentapeptide repeat-containing protein n=1 Tax=Microbulbifer sp. ZKSA006 TaxID=3243390 RepID=UPI0040394552